MFESSGFRAAEVQFDKDAKVVASTQAVIDLAAANNITDLVIMSHGWNNDIADARNLYTKLAKSLRSVVDANAVASLSGRGVRPCRGVLAVQEVLGRRPDPRRRSRGDLTD